MFARTPGRVGVSLLVFDENGGDEEQHYQPPEDCTGDDIGVFIQTNCRRRTLVSQRTVIITGSSLSERKCDPNLLFKPMILPVIYENILDA